MIKEIGIVLIFLAGALFISGVILTITAPYHPEYKTVKCYDEEHNQIIGQTCLEKSEDYRDRIFFITFLMSMVLGFGGYRLVMEKI